MIKRGVFLVLLIILSFSAIARGPDFDNGGPKIDMDELAERQLVAFDIVRNCRVESFIPPDPEGRVTKIDVIGLVDGKCHLMLHSEKGITDYLLPKEIYTQMSGIQDILKGECKGECAYIQEISKAPEPANEQEKCIQDCLNKDCNDADFSCESTHLEKCEEECGIEKGPDPDDMDELERCIYDCVGPDIICQPLGGETGEDNPDCQECADKCTGIYGSGNNCLTEEEWEAREKACMTCEHCYGEAVYGPSGDGYDCIVDARCFDASSEWGDDPGTGPDSYEEGHEPSADQVYWEGFSFDLDIEEQKLKVTQGDEEKEISFSFEEGVTAEKGDNQFILKKDNQEVIVEDNSKEMIEKHANRIEQVQEVKIYMEEDRPIYELKTREKARLFGFIPVDMEKSKRIDANDLELIDEEKPWWGFLAVEE